MDPVTEDQKTKLSIDVDLTGSKTLRAKFLKQLHAGQIDASRKGIPFDYRAAKIDFELAQQDAYRKNIGKYKREGTVQDNIPVKIDINEYTRKTRFKKIKTKPIIEKKVVDGVAVNYHTGNYEVYQSYSRGEKISVQVDLEKPERAPNGIPETKPKGK